MDAEQKTFRLMTLQSRLLHGEVLRKRALAQEFGVSERSIQRDLENLRVYFEQQNPPRELIYSRAKGGFRLDGGEQLLTGPELLYTCKILLESRSVPQKEMEQLIRKLLGSAASEETCRQVESLVQNELFHYIPPRHGKSVIDTVWQLGQSIKRQQILEVAYSRPGKDGPVHRQVEPVGLMFSDFYFYLIAFLLDEEGNRRFPDADTPTIYRVDRIETCKETGRRFQLPYKDRFQEGEFRKRVQFMTGGPLRKVRFKYKGTYIDNVLDRLPTAEILRKDADGWIIEAECYGNGIEVWLRGQGGRVEVMDL